MSEVKIYYSKNVIYNMRPQALLIQMVDENDLEVMDEELKLIEENTQHGFIHVSVRVRDWNDDLSPWAAPAVFGNHDFKGNAKETLDELLCSTLPDIILKESPDRKIPVIIGGYSLAAFFALWAAFESDVFKAVAAASPSVWFPGWMEFISERKINAEAVYLSLGDREDKTRNIVMAKVRENMEKTYDLIKNQESVSSPCFILNSGNHFNDTAKRTADAFSYCLNEILK